MKKFSLFVFLLIGMVMFSQEETKTQGFDKTKLNELKLNLAYTIGGIPEITYERILSEETSAGVSLRFAADKDINERFSLSPYFRYFFGKKNNATGFFVEGNLMYVSMNNWRESYGYYYDANGNYTYSYKKDEDKYSNIGVGFAIGGKWVTKKGFLFEIYGGPVRFITNSDLNDKYSTDFTGRAGIVAGYRF